MSRDFWLLGRGRWLIFGAVVAAGVLWPRPGVLEITSDTPGAEFVVVGSPGLPFAGERFVTPMRVEVPRARIDAFYVARADGGRIRVTRSWRRFGLEGSASTTGRGWIRVRMLYGAHPGISGGGPARPDGAALVRAVDRLGDDASRLFLGEGVRCTVEGRLEAIGELSSSHRGPSCDVRSALR